jgi:hydroxyacylglutathione hydrolase
MQTSGAPRVSSPTPGEAIVVDPAIAIDQYLELASRHRFGITHAVETHTHADRVSGNRRLAELTSAAIHVSAAARPAFESVPLRAGDSIAVGGAVLTARATPGHRPEHLSLLLSDRGRADEPLALLTGDALLVGEVGRPDLAVDPREGGGRAAIAASVVRARVPQPVLRVDGGVADVLAALVRELAAL